jgi:uncharacterized coiled-coil protein SlyX
MSGAASIAAAKNRRTKPDPSLKPNITCSSLKPGSCPLPSGSKGQQTVPRMFDEESMQITGPMHVMQVLKVHEQRLNKIDSKLTQQSVPSTPFAQAMTSLLPSACQETGQCDAECYDRISTLEEKVQMLEEVIMNLQLTLTNVQSFAMETSLAMMKLQNQLTAAPVPAALSATLPSLQVVTLTVSDQDTLDSQVE